VNKGFSKNGKQTLDSVQPQSHALLQSYCRTVRVRVLCLCVDVEDVTTKC